MDKVQIRRFFVSIAAVIVSSIMIALNIELGETLLLTASIILIEVILLFDYKYFSQNLHIVIFQRNKFIRISVAYLIKIKVQDKYLLVRGERLKHQFQPVGGAYKYYKLPKSLETDTRSDDMMPSDHFSDKDLRLRIKGSKYLSFWDWFYKNTDREISPWREFQEELLKNNILDKEIFSYIHYNILGEKRMYDKYSSYADGPQVIHATIYELKPTDKQLDCLKKLLKDNDQNFTNLYWATEEEIRRLGVIPNKKFQNIFSETSKWIL